MLTLDVRRDATLDDRTRDQLAHVADGLRRRHPELPPPIVVPWSRGPAVVLDGEDAWLYAPASRDPGLGVVPRRQRRELRRIAATGERFDAVAIAHELDRDGPARSLVPRLRRGPRACTDELARVLVSPVPAHPGVVRAAGMLDALVNGGAPARAAGALERLLDPIVFGVVAPFGLVQGVPAVFLPLAAWRW